MVGWRFRANMQEIDIEKHYDGPPTIFSTRLFYGGEFTKFPGRRYVKGKERYVDLLDIDEFCVHDIDEMMETLSCVEEGKLLYYHFKRPFLDLDFGLFALASDSDINHLGTYVGKHKLIEVYVEHGKTVLHTYTMSSTPSKVRIEEIVDQPSCSKRLFLEWKETETGDCIGSSKPDVVPTKEIETDKIDAQCETQGIFDEFDEILNEEPGGNTHESDNRDDVDDSGDSGDNDDNLDNLLDEPEIDMNEFLLNIDEYIEWVGDLGGSNVKETETREIDDIEVVNNEVFLYESSSDEGGSNRRRKSIKAIRRAMENSEARVSDPLYVYQKFTSSEELKDAIRQHAVETRREIDFIKNDKNRVRAILKVLSQALVNLIHVGTVKAIKKMKKTSVHGYFMLASGNKMLTGRSRPTKEHRCLQTRNMKACTYKFLAKKIVQQIESNPTVPTRALQEQLQREYQVDISKMKVFRAKTEALNQVKGDYAGQYTTLRDYVQELRTRNPGTTVKIEVESEPNPASETRTFKRIYIFLGPLKKGFLAGKRDYLGLDGTFMKGPYPRMILTAGLDGNNCTYPLPYAVVEAKNINSWTWFLRCLGDDIDLQANYNFTFISDRQKVSLLQAIGTLYPCAEHGFWLRHIHENMKKIWRGKVFQEMLWNCASTTTIQEFNHAMEELRKLNNDCYKWVKAIPPQHWSKAHFTWRAHCDGLLNNLCETINNQIKKARDQPIITCLEYIREYLMLRIVIDKAVGPLNPTATSVLERNKSDAAQCVGKFCGNGKYRVSGPWMDQCVVDMVQHTCSCRRWELTGIPCKHALVAIWDMRKNKQNVGVPGEWVHSTYWLKTWKEIYSFKIEPINGRRMWEKFPCPTTLLPPNHHAPIGRPRNKRRKSVVELEDMVKGGTASRKDQSLGHNKRSCKGQSSCDASSSKKGKARNKAKSVGDGTSIKKGKDGKKDQSAGDGTSSKKGNVGKKAQSVGGGRQSGTQSACDGISSRTRKAGKKGKTIA
uniref:SWIM-type domain-containing protein n=1 Tax=Lactuca sativa TaxID=4236 RepID=A0A9R1VUW1_LACSA|nr:hypothetical protein LSAT_V11C400228200 [Lactuca sativa]